MDERPIEDEELEEQPEIVEEEPKRKPKAPEAADVFALPPKKDKEAWRSGSGCGPRMRLYLYIVMAVCVLGLLVAGVSMMRQGVWVNLDQGRRVVYQNLPFEMSPDEKRQVGKNLDLFRAVLEASDDPYPIMGEFMKMVRASFKDARLTVDEVEEINSFLERVIEESGIPPMQLESKL
jgi:hypothetical protein